MKGEAGAVTVFMWIATISSFVSAEVVFTEVPGPDPVLLPIGRHIIFNCSVSPGHTILGWRVYVPDVDLEYFTDSEHHALSLAAIGITVRNYGLYSSQLVVNATRENLLTYALCEARTGMDDTTLTQRGVNVTVYGGVNVRHVGSSLSRWSSVPYTHTMEGPPETPTNLSFRVKDDFLTVSWFSSTIPKVSLTFDLVLINTRTSSRTEVTIYESMQHQFSVEDMEDVQSCDVLEVLVTARNDAGVGKRITISARFPALPDLNKLQHLLSKSNRGGVTLTVTFMMPMVCPSNTVANYTLAVVLEDSEPNMIEQSTASSAGPAVSLEVGDLMENEAYTYSIVAINAIGRATTASTSFRTTNVQGVGMCLVEGSIYSIQCSYIAGSNIASGCSYVLVGVVEDTRNINGSIHMSSTVNQDVPNIKDYGRILVYDEGNVLVMNGTLDSEKTGSCTTTDTTEVEVTEIGTAITTAAKRSQTYLIIIGVPLCVVIILMVAAIAIIVCVFKHGYSPTKEKVENYQVTSTNDWKPVNDHENKLQDGEMKKEVGMDEFCPVELLQTDPVYSTLSTNSSRREATPSQDKEGNHDAFSGTYSEINDIKIPIYHVLESNQPMRSISADQSQLRLSAGYFLSRGDTPTPVIRKNKSMPEGELIYSEISAISEGKQDGK